MIFYSKPGRNRAGRDIAECGIASIAYDAPRTHIRITQSGAIDITETQEAAAARRLTHTAYIHPDYTRSKSYRAMP